MKPSGKTILVCAVCIAIGLAASPILSHIINATKSGPQTAEVNPEFKQRFSDFLREAVRLQALTNQGVDISTFGNQLATATAAYAMAVEIWPPEHEQEAKMDFRMAMDGWKLVNRLWQKKVSNEYSFPSTSDPDLIAALEVYAPRQILHNGKGKFYVSSADEVLSDEYIPFDANIRLMMTLTSRHFNEGRKRISPQSTTPQPEKSPTK